jgi:hypothetical protein
MLRGTLATNLIPSLLPHRTLTASRSFGGLVRAGYLREREQHLLHLLVPSASSGSVRGGLAIREIDLRAVGWSPNRPRYRWRCLRGAAKAASRPVIGSRRSTPESHAEGVHANGDKHITACLRLCPLFEPA